MQFVGGTSVRKIGGRVGGFQNDSTLQLGLYGDAPEGELTLTEFETFAFDRLQLLRTIDMMRANSVKDINESIYDAERKHGMRAEGCNRKDVFSHFTLRLAFCKTQELRNWFCKQECQLFRSRFDMLSSQEQVQFLSRHGLDYVVVAPEELKKMEHLLRKTPTFAPIATETYYIVPFEKALDLISRRRVYLSGGNAFVPRSELISLVVGQFRASLNHSLAVAFRASSSVDDIRVRSLVDHISSLDVGPVFKASAVAGSVTPDQIPTLANTSFPLCMQNLYENLVRDSHLRYGGRQQFGLFLKGIGLSLEQALVFWRKIFSRRPGVNFDKAYSYNIRHNYGKEGKRADYTPLSCSKIINGSAPGHGDHHGCPFRHYDERHLVSKLRSRGIAETSIASIAKLVQDRHYQLACREYFSATHKGVVGASVGNHPNEYFTASIDLNTPKSAKQEPNSKQEPNVPAVANA